MLTISEYDRNANYRELVNDPGVFHTALRNVLRGEKRFHVGKGEPGSFDLVYEDNDIRAKRDPAFPDSDFFRSELFFPPYYQYDENDTGKITLDLFDGFEEIFFEEANEYTVVIAQLATAHTDLRITFRDSRVKLFPWIGERAACRETPETENTLYVQQCFFPLYTPRDRFCTTGLFHCLFMLQWLTDLPAEKIRYLSLSIRKTEGIGSILSVYSLVSQEYAKKGIRVFLEPGCTRFSEDLLSRYFVIGNVPADASETNTVYVKCFNSFVLNHLVDRNTARISLDMLQPSFVAQMREYADGVLGEKKVLGVLLRGTDYVVANFAGNRYPADIGNCIRIVGERIDRYGYDKIFVATEDAALLEAMISAFPHKVLAISQERHTVDDVRDVKFLSELEKKRYSGRDYEASVEDTTVNYFYAMYLLSRCESLIANCMCNGINIATSFNEGKYTRCEIISDLPEE